MMAFYFFGKNLRKAVNPELRVHYLKICHYKFFGSTNRLVLFSRISEKQDFQIYEQGTKIFFVPLNGKYFDQNFRIYNFFGKLVYIYLS